MTLYTNCEKFYCSMERENNKIDGYIAVHLTVTKKPKYQKINNKVNICALCPFDEKICDDMHIKVMQVDD